jgi:hypothetical protein
MLKWPDGRGTEGLCTQATTRAEGQLLVAEFASNGSPGPSFVEVGI